jgi:hypothetical protein
MQRRGITSGVLSEDSTLSSSETSLRGLTSTPSALGVPTWSLLHRSHTYSTSTNMPCRAQQKKTIIYHWLKNSILSVYSTNNWRYYDNLVCNKYGSKTAWIVTLDGSQLHNGCILTNSSTRELNKMSSYAKYSWIAKYSPLLRRQLQCRSYTAGILYCRQASHLATVQWSRCNDKQNEHQRVIDEHMTK